MAAEKTLALVLRATDWSETSRVATLWTREFGRVRVLAKGGRRLKSNFESALDLLTVCSIVLLRKFSGSLDLLTEAQVVKRFPRLRSDLPALYAAYYVAELLADWTEDYDPHPDLFDEALATLATLGASDVAAGPRVARFELVMLHELGYGPALKNCAMCGRLLGGEVTDCREDGRWRMEDGSKTSPSSILNLPSSPAPPHHLAALAFSPAAGGVLCPACRNRQRDGRPLSVPAWQALLAWSGSGEGWRGDWDPAVRAEVRQVLGQYVTYLMGRRPRLLPYLGS